jgi:putative ABC transport system permease protein
MFRLAVRSILANKVRFLLPAIGVVLGVAFVSGSLLYGASVRASLDGVQPDFAVRVSPRTIETSVPADLVSRLRGVAGVGEVRPVAEGSAFVVDGEGSLVGPPALAGGVNYDAGYRLTSGRAPAGPDEVAIDDWSAKRTGYRVGDRFRVVVAGDVRDVRLSGIFTASDARVAQGGTLTAFDDATARGLFATDPDSYTAVDLTAAPGTTEAALAAAVTALLPEDLVAETSAEIGGPGADDKLTEILLVFAGVALFVSVFLVANTFTMLSAARAREHALLRAVGAGRRHVLRMVLAEAVLLGVVATVAGYLLGIAGAASLDALFSVGDGPPVPLRVFGVEPVLAAVGVGVGVTVLAAYVPARRAAAVPPIAALRTGLPPTGKSLRRRNIAGLVVTFLGAAVTVAGVDTADLVYLGAPLLLLGMVILTPLFGVWLTALLRRPMTRLAGVRGTLAVENTRRNPRRTGTTASALMIGLSICAAVTVPIASVAEEDARLADTGDRADLRISAVDFAELGADTAGRVARLPGVRAVTPADDSDTLLVEVDPGRVDVVRADIRRALDNPTLVVSTHAEHVAAEGARFDVVLNLLYALLSISVLIGALSVVNTMTMSTVERIREIGLLRAVGLGRRQVGTILRLESVIIAALGAVTGLAAGCVIGAVAVASQGGIAVVMPWDRLGLFVAVTAAIGIVAAMGPARKAARTPILDAIHTE